MGRKRVITSVGVAAITAAVGGLASAQIQTAGPLLVNLRADNPTAGQAAWTNSGTLGGIFTEVGDAAVTTIGGSPFVTFDANEAYRGPTAPAGVTGSGDRTIEVWMHNANIATEDTMVAWGHRGGPDGTNLGFNNGSSAAFGAVGHWGAPDMGWNGTPVVNTIHHLVYTYDGTTARVYADGVEKNSRAVALNTHALATDTINLVAQNNADGSLAFVSSDGMSLGVVRVHDGALTPIQVIQNFNAGINADVPEPAGLGLLAAGGLLALRRRRGVTRSG